MLDRVTVTDTRSDIITDLRVVYLGYIYISVLFNAVQECVFDGQLNELSNALPFVSPHMRYFAPIVVVQFQCNSQFFDLRVIPWLCRRLSC